MLKCHHHHPEKKTFKLPKKNEGENNPHIPPQKSQWNQPKKIHHFKPTSKPPTSTRQKIPQQQGLTHPSKDSPTGQAAFESLCESVAKYLLNSSSVSCAPCSFDGKCRRVLSSIFLVGFVHNGKKVVTKPLKLTVPKSPKIDGFQVRNRSFPGGYFQVSC